MSMVWRLGTKTLDCSAPRVIAIVNAAPDSFFAGSRLPAGQEDRRASLEALLAAAPDVIDVGGLSTRPGSRPVSTAEETSRVVPVIEELRRLDAHVPITVDTYTAEVAEAALSAGADGVNDISAGRLDPRLLEVVAHSGCGYVLMHMQGTPQTMQDAPCYADCVGEVREFLRSGLERLAALGIALERVVVDPGIGFGKRFEDNLALVRDAAALRELGRPLVFGVSRKSFLGRLTGAQDPADRLAATLGVTWRLLECGVMLHRVHDAAAVRQLMNAWAGLRAG